MEVTADFPTRTRRFVPKHLKLSTCAHRWKMCYEFNHWQYNENNLEESRSSLLTCVEERIERWTALRVRCNRFSGIPFLLFATFLFWTVVCLSCVSISLGKNSCIVDWGGWEDCPPPVHQVETLYKCAQPLYHLDFVWRVNFVRHDFVHMS